VKSISNQFNNPRSTLRDLIKFNKTFTPSTGRPTAFIGEEEKELAQHLNLLFFNNNIHGTTKQRNGKLRK